MAVSHTDHHSIPLPHYSLNVVGDLNTPDQSFHYNSESNLDLQYGMALVTGKQAVQLYQVGDHVVGEPKVLFVSSKLN